MTLHATIALCLLATAADPTSRILYKLDSIPAGLVTNNTNVRVVPTQRGKALEVRFGRVDWPNVYFRPAKDTWDWSNASGIAVDVYNPEPRPIQVYIRVDNAGANGTDFCATGEVLAVPKTWTTLKLYLNSGKPVLWGMRGLPAIGPIDTGKPIDKTRITAFQVFLNRPDAEHTLILSNVSLFGSGRAPGADVAMPFVDRFGQYAHQDWPGKLKSEAEFAVRLKAEHADIAAHPAPSDRDVYGGFANGPKLKATGWFRTEKRGSKWWFVDPDGRLFFSLGMDCLTNQEVTFVEKREKWFEWLPASDDARFGRLFANATGAYLMADEISGKGRTFNFYGANLIRKYGSDWQNKWRDLSYVRLKSWGFNTIGNWSRQDVMDNAQMPFTACAHINADFRRIEGGGGYWGKMMDVYDPGFAEAAEAAIAPVAKRYASNRYLLGYFVDNELAWDSIDWATLASPPDQPCRVALIKQLKDKYLTIESLNRAWGTSAKSWDDLRMPATLNASSRADLGAYVYAFSRRYFETVKAAIRKYDKHHLYLGCRFMSGAPRSAVRACADIADVVSYNIYERGVGCSRFSGDNDIGKPVVIGEFHFGAMDRGMFHPGLVDAGSQQGRADSFIDYVRSALDCPAVVGCHWFQYVDEPVTGRYFDGENYNIGFVDVTDTPYPELVAAARKVGAEIYTRR